jgi:trehalose 6-phosphate synthase
LKDTPAGVAFPCRTVHIGVFPIGIEPQNCIQDVEKPEIKARIASLAQHHREHKIIIGVDRLDYIKGIPQKLNAVELFLDKHPEWIGKLVLIQVGHTESRRRERIPRFGK